MEQRTEGRSKTRTPSFTILFQSAENLLTQSLRSNTLKKIGKLFATETELEGQRIEKDKAEYFRAVQTGGFLKTFPFAQNKLTIFFKKNFKLQKN